MMHPQVCRWPTCFVESLLLEATCPQMAAYTLCFVYKMCPQHISSSGYSEPLCQQGIGQCADSSDLGRCGDAKQGKLGCKVSWQFRYCGKRTSSFCTAPISVKARITPFNCQFEYWKNSPISEAADLCISLSAQASCTVSM